MLNLVGYFFCVHWDDHMIFILRFVNVVYYVDLWMFHHPGITRKKFHLIVVYDSFNILLILFYNFVEDFGILHSSGIFGSVQSLSHVWLFGTPWTVARQASLSITNSQSLLKLMSIKLVMPSSHLILCLPLLPPSIFPSISPSMNIQDWFPLWTGWISLQSKGLSRVFSNTTVQKHQFFGAQPSSQSNSHIHTWPLEKPSPWLDGPLLAK